MGRPHGLLGRARAGNGLSESLSVGRRVATHHSRARNKTTEFSRDHGYPRQPQTYRLCSFGRNVGHSSTSAFGKMHTSREVKQSPQYAAVAKFIAGEDSLNGALDTFCGDVEAKFNDTQDTEAVEELLWQAWRAVVTIAASTPHASESRQKLVDYVLEVQNQPTLSKDDQTCVVQDGTVWKISLFSGWRCVRRGT